jgi:hypothetical protein
MKARDLAKALIKRNTDKPGKYNTTRYWIEVAGWKLGDSYFSEASRDVTYFRILTEATKIIKELQAGE